MEARLGFVGAYTLIVLAAPFFLKKRGELKAQHVILCVVAMALMIDLWPLMAAFVPLPDPPVRLFSYAFVAYLWFGFIRVMAMAASKTGTRGAKYSDGSPEIPYAVASGGCRP